MSNGITAPVITGLAIGIIFLLSGTAHSSYASSNFQSMDVQVGNKMYSLGYYMSNGGSINSVSVSREYGTMMTLFAKPTTRSEESSESTTYSLDLTFPRELYDELNFTEHELVVFADGQDMAVDVLEPSTCSQITTHIHPIPASTEKIEVLYADILGTHTHIYPPKLGLQKTIEVGQESDSTKFSVFLQTDAIECNISFSAEQKKIHIDIEGRNAEQVTAKGGSDKGFLSLSFPYDLLGGNYTVLVDGKPIMFNESQYFTKNYTDIGVQSVEQDDFTPIKASHLSFNYPMNAEDIDIIGTTAAPEFGSIATFVMAVSIVGAIVAAKHFRLWKR